MVLSTGKPPSGQDEKGQEEESPTRAIILFDGVCNLCAQSVQFVVKRDRRGYFSFCSLQSPAGQRLLKNHGLDPTAMDTFVLIDSGKCYTKSSAALRVTSKLNYGWPLLAGCLVIPAFVRDWCYSLVAANRYRWFGKTDQFMVPTEDLASRFLD